MHIYIHILYRESIHIDKMEYCSAITKNATTWMDLESFTLSERSQTDKDKYSVLSLICET